MPTDSVDSIKGETSMTDRQFDAYVALRDKCETLEKENAQLREKQSCHAGATPSDVWTKMMIASVVDILTTSKDLEEAYERFSRVANVCDIHKE